MRLLDVVEQEVHDATRTAGTIARSIVVSFLHPKRTPETWGIHPGMKVADFGAGSGAFTLEFAQMVGPLGRVYAIDVQKDLLTRIKNSGTALGLKNIDIIWSDLEEAGSAKLDDNALNFVLISNLLFQVKDKATVIREAARIVRKGGRVAIIDWKDSFRGMGPLQKDVVNKDAARTTAENAGLQFTRELKVGSHHWGLLFTKP